jgi:hypothetical protein
VIFAAGRAPIRRAAPIWWSRHHEYRAVPKRWTRRCRPEPSRPCLLPSQEPTNKRPTGRPTDRPPDSQQRWSSEYECLMDEPRTSFGPPTGGAPGRFKGPHGTGGRAIVGAAIRPWRSFAIVGGAASAHRTAAELYCPSPDVSRCAGCLLHARREPAALVIGPRAGRPVVPPSHTLVASEEFALFVNVAHYFLMSLQGVAMCELARESCRAVVAFGLVKL